MEEADNQTTGSLTHVVKRWKLPVLFSANSEMSKEQRVRYLSVIILVGFVAAVFFHYVRGVYSGLPYPHNTFLFMPADRFNDFVHMYNLSKNLNPYFENYFIQSNYYPFANIVFYLFTFVSQNLSFLFFTGLFVLLLICINVCVLKLQNRYEHLIGVFVFSFLTYPFLMTVDRGNIEGLLFVLLYLSVCFRDRRPVLSSGFLSMAIAMKLYPAVFLILLLSEKRYKQIALTVFGVFVLTFGGLLLHMGGVGPNLQFILSGFGIHEVTFFANNDSVLAGLSLFTPLKILLRLKNGLLINTVAWSQLMRIYVLVVLACFAMLALYVSVVEKVLWKKAAVLVFAMLLFPQVSFDYKLMHIFIPVFLFINSDQRSRSDWFYASGFGLLLIPKNYYFLPGFTSNSGASDIGIAVFVNPLLMLAMLLVIVLSGLRSYAITRRASVVTARTSAAG